MSISTSPSLLIRIRDPNAHDAWTEFTTLYTAVIRTYCVRRGLQPTDIDDIVQDVMSSISRSIANFDYDPSKGSFRAWLGAVTVNKINDHFARRQRSFVANSHLSTADLDPATAVDPDTEWVNIFSERVFRAACARARVHFTDVVWRSFERSWIDNAPAEKIAAELGIRIHSVYVNKSRVLKQIETEISILADDLPILESNCDPQRKGEN